VCITFTYIRMYTLRSTYIESYSKSTHSLSLSGLEEFKLGEELEVMVLRVGLPVKGLPYPYSPVSGRETRVSMDPDCGRNKNTCLTIQPTLMLVGLHDPGRGIYGPNRLHWQEKNTMIQQQECEYLIQAFYTYIQY